jgi:hypothetical protein
VRIVDLSTHRRIVTAIEILSPGNKVGRASRAAYVTKRKDLLADPKVNLVEIDLVREGDPLLMVRDSHVPWEYYHPYRVSVFRAAKRGQVEFFKATYRERLPVIPIPLRPRDRGATLDLQAVIDQCYENGDYARIIDYRKPPHPRLRDDDADWADRLLRKAKRR